jgi:hypothetical protein
MKDGQAAGYKIEHTIEAKAQIQAAAAIATQAGKLAEFVAILKKAVLRMQTDPNGWGDPEYRSTFIDGVCCHGIIRPVVFRYVVYEQIRSVVLLGVHVYADFG